MGIKTVEGKDVEAHIFDSKVFINEAQVTTADVDASNGVVHIINAVLIPTFIETKLRANTTPISLARFDGGATDFKWTEENDPVMGGVSTNCTFSTTGDFVGVVEIVPSLKAPGFCFARTSTSKKDFPDVSSKTALEIEYTAAVDYTGFKAAFAADTLIVQFESFKADFNVTAGSTVATIPFNSFSNKWSSATGEPTKKSPPTAKNLRDISQLQIWAEGVKGPFNLQIKEIRASNGAPATVCKTTEYCCPDAKKCLTPTSTSCKHDATACGDGEVCCPLTKICVKPGADCAAPDVCKTSEYCCPDAKACLTPTNPGVFCTDASSCKSSEVCCPLTKLCVAAGKSCVAP